MSDAWRTPPAIFRKLDDEFHFDLDAAASADNSLCQQFLPDAFATDDWPGERIFCNPPYGKMLRPFVERCALEAWKGKTVVALIPMRTRANWFHESVIHRAAEVRAVRKRPKFLLPDGTVPRFTMSCDSCIVVWRGAKTGTVLLTSWNWE